MFAYNASTCNGGSLTDAFQFAAERGVTADSGERGGQETWGKRAACTSAAAGLPACLPACLPLPARNPLPV